MYPIQSQLVGDGGKSDINKDLNFTLSLKKSKIDLFQQERQEWGYEATEVSDTRSTNI